MKRLFILLLAGLFMAGCTVNPSKPTSPTAKLTPVQVALISADDANKSLSLMLNAANKSVDQLAKSGEIALPDRNNIHAYFVLVAEDSKKVAGVIELAKVEPNSNWQSQISQILSNVANLDPSTVNIKDPKEKANFVNYINTIRGLITLLNPGVN